MSATSPDCILYAGPSTFEMVLRLDGIDLRPPAERGTIAALIDSHSPGVVAVADGMFHQTLAVGHAELREALARGWQVWGLSSLGAIRACEMRALGMCGYGAVYQQFVDDEEFSDDEVALLHAPEPPYRAVSEPLIHIRCGLQALVDEGVITAAARRQVMTKLSSLWYGDRTLGLVKSLLIETAPESTPAIHRWLARFHRYRLKSTDLQRFLQERPWTAGRCRN